MAPWTQEEEFKLLFIIVQQTNPKIDWVDVAAKMGRTGRSITQHYDAMKKKSTLPVGASSTNKPTPTKKRPAKNDINSPTAKKAKTAPKAGKGDDGDEDGQDEQEESSVKSTFDGYYEEEETPTKYQPQKVKVEKTEDSD